MSAGFLIDKSITSRSLMTGNVRNDESRNATANKPTPPNEYARFCTTWRILVRFMNSGPSPHGHQSIGEVYQTPAAICSRLDYLAVDGFHPGNQEWSEGARRVLDPTITRHASISDFIMMCQPMAHSEKRREKWRGPAHCWITTSQSRDKRTRTDNFRTSVLHSLL